MHSVEFILEMHGALLPSPINGRGAGGEGAFLLE